MGRLEEDFAIGLRETIDRTYVLSLDSKHDAEAVGRLTLAVDTTTFDIVRATVSDPLTPRQSSLPDSPDPGRYCQPLPLS